MADTEAFDDLVAALNYPMFVVTTTDPADGDAPVGCLVGFASQASIAPPRFVVGVSRQNRTFRAAEQASYLAVHLLPRDGMELAELFGGETGDEVDKFGRCRWRNGPQDMPILDDAAAWFVGRVLERFDFGDHVGHLLEPVAGDASDLPADFLTFDDVRDITPGHEAS